MHLQLHDKTFVPFRSPSEIAVAVAQVAAAVNAVYGEALAQGETVMALSVLKGAFVFTADLVRNLTIPVEVQFVRVSTYGDETESSGEVLVFSGPTPGTLTGKHVLVIEDIVDSGFTADYLHERLQNEYPLSLRLATLLYKPDSFKGQWKPDFVGMGIPSRFVVGYGLDYAERGRELAALWEAEH